MATITPLPGIRYAGASGTDVSALITPPYDVLDQTDKQRLLDRDRHNFVRIDLPHVPPKAAGPPGAYAEAREILDRWIREGVMVADRPGVYAYHQEYTYAGQAYVRKMFFARLRLEPFGEGSIFPHEQTFGGPKEDRLALTKATETNTSPIFGLYPDAANTVAKRLEQALEATPLLHGELDGVQNRLWAVDDPAAIREVTALMADKPVFIADGHHRTGTAMMYRDWLAQQQGAGLPAEHPANFVLCVFCAMEDPGLLILPTHRVLPGLPVAVDGLARDSRIEVQTLTVSGPSEAVEQLGGIGPQAVALYNAGDQRYHAIWPKSADLLKDLEPAHTSAWHRLGLAFLHAYLIDRLIAPQSGGEAVEIHYVKSDQGAIDEATATGGSVFLMQPTTMEELRAVCQAGDLMPQKSTFFYPKLASGLVVNPLR